MYIKLLNTVACNREAILFSLILSARNGEFQFWLLTDHAGCYLLRSNTIYLRATPLRCRNCAIHSDLCTSFPEVIQRRSEFREIEIAITLREGKLKEVFVDYLYKIDQEAACPCRERHFWVIIYSRVRAKLPHINIDRYISIAADDMIKLEQGMGLPSASTPEQHHRVRLGCRREVICLNKRVMQS